MIPNTGLLLELNYTQKLLSMDGSKLKCCHDKKEVYYYLPTSATMLMKPIQISFVTIKPCEDLEHHQVATRKLKFTRWIQTTEKLITTEISQFPIEDKPEKILDMNLCFARISQKVNRSNNQEVPPMILFC